MDNLWTDIRSALRDAARHPAFCAIVVITLAVGIGANTAIFSVVEAVLLQPLPYENAEDLVVIWRDLRNRNVTHYRAAEADVVDYRAARSLHDVAALSMFAGPLVDGDGDAERVRIGFVTTNFFSLLGVRPQIGRDFEALDARATQGAPEGERGGISVILSYNFWERRYAADPGVLGRTVRISGAPATVIGVAPPGFRYFAPAHADLFPNVEVWAPQQIDFSQAGRSNWYLHTLARLAPGATLADARAELETIAANQRAEFAVYEAAGTHARVEPLIEEVTGAVRPVMLALFGAVLFVLLIGCVNVANLMLLRAADRARETAVRVALGADRGRLLQQMVTESVLMALLAGALGVAIAAAGIRWLVRVGPDGLPRLYSVGIDGPVLVFTGVVSLLAAVLFGALPALHVSGAGCGAALHPRADVGGSRGQKRLRGALVVVEAALSLVLLVGAGLMVRSFAAVRAVDPGFDAGGVLSFQTTVPFSEYASVWERSGFKDELAARLRALPGVESVGAASSIPLTGTHSAAPYGTEAMVADGDEGDFQQAHIRSVTPGYFETMGTRLLAGRIFTAADNEEARRRFVAIAREQPGSGMTLDNPGLAIIDELFAERAWPGEDAVGKRVYVKVTNPPSWYEVIGVVEHERQTGLSGPSQQNIYFLDTLRGSPSNTMWVVRSAGDPAQLVGAIRAELAGLDDEIPMARVNTLDQIVRDAQSHTRFALQLIGGFALIALSLAALGLYAVLAHAVRQRAGEFGVRMAFGAATGTIRRMVLGQGLVLVGAGVALGLGGGWWLTRLMEAMLVGVTPTDPLTFVVVAGLFLAVGAAACYLPALRATRVDPIVTLRGE